MCTSVSFLIFQKFSHSNTKPIQQYPQILYKYFSNVRHSPLITHSHIIHATIRTVTAFPTPQQSNRFSSNILFIFYNFESQSYYIYPTFDYSLHIKF